MLTQNSIIGLDLWSNLNLKFKSNKEVLCVSQKQDSEGKKVE